MKAGKVWQSPRARDLSYGIPSLCSGLIYSSALHAEAVNVFCDFFKTYEITDKISRFTFRKSEIENLHTAQMSGSLIGKVVLQNPPKKFLWNSDTPMTFKL